MMTQDTITISSDQLTEDNIIQYSTGDNWIKIPKSLPSPPDDEQSEHLQSVAVKVVELEELTEDESRLRLHLERKVEKAFYECGKALMGLRDKRLYRSTHRTFEEYCHDRFGYGKNN